MPTAGLFLEASDSQRLGKYAADVIVILVLFVVLFFVLAALTAAAGLSREAGAAIASCGGYLLSASDYGHSAGFSTRGESLRRYRDSLSPLQGFVAGFAGLALPHRAFVSNRHEVILGHACCSRLGHA